MCSASLLRVPKALRSSKSTAGRQGRRFVLEATSYLHRASTWLVPLNVLALYKFHVGTLRRSASHMQPTAICAYA